MREEGTVVWMNGQATIMYYVFEFGRGQLLAGKYVQTLLQTALLRLVIYSKSLKYPLQLAVHSPVYVIYWQLPIIYMHFIRHRRLIYSTQCLDAYLIELNNRSFLSQCTHT
jgi:hypothetical protein